jgi:hypothetical protein
VAEEVGAAYVSLIPSAKGFSRQAKAKLKEEMGRGGNDPVTVPVKPELDPVSGALRAELQRQLQALAKRVALDLPVGADTDPMRAQLNQQITQLRAALKLEIPTEPGDALEYHRKLRELIDGTRVTQHVKVEPRGGGGGAGPIDRAFGSDGSSSSESAVRSGSSLGRLFMSGFGSTLLNPLIGIPAVVIAAIGAPFVAAITAGATLAGGSLALILVGAFGLRADEQLKAAMAGLGETINKTLSDAAQPLKGPFLEAIGIVGQAIKELGPTLKEVFKILGPTIPELARGLAGALKQLADTGALEAFAKVGADALQQLAMALPDIGNALSQFMISMSQAKFGPEEFGKVLRTLADVIRIAGDIMVWLAARIEDIRAINAANADILMNHVIPAFKTAGQVVADVVGGWLIWIDTFTKTIIAAADTIARWWDGLWNNMGAKVSSTAGAVVGFAHELPGKILSAVGDLGSLLLSAGQNVVQGLIDGIRSKLGALASMASQMASTIRNYLPFSPAKEGPLSGSGNPFHSGQVIASDMAAGVRSQLPRVASAGEQLAGAFGLGGGSLALAGAAASSALVADWAPGATGDPVLDGLRELIRFRFRGDPNAALRTA